ncbi:hypothetical protein THTE_1074 [Thermogutta terrifontis]|uniref:Uncharacterized protein n=1 Tax=Thermogutta terrifontis TaxID=1331910 RepID=A0A286RCI0_9BACT|nr:hypothetical protein [Thermogutta terrifontis]ASV73676.1 hypothetical protein THTE_1074 [Thermogutta terrifontis]
MKAPSGQGTGAFQHEFLFETLALAWKYWRETQLLMLALGIIPSVLAVFFAANTRPTQSLTVVPFVGAALFALAFGAMAFAGETERKTDTLLRALPVKTSRIVLAVSIVALWGVTVCLLMGFVILTAAGTLTNDSSLFQRWQWDISLSVLFWVGLAGEFFVWGLLFSIFVQRVIWSAVMGAAVAYVLDIFIVTGFYNLEQVFFPDQFIPKFGTFTWESSGQLLPVRLLAVASVLTIDAILVGKWLKSSDEPLRWLKSRLLFLRLGGFSAPLRVRQIVSRLSTPAIPNLSAAPMRYLVWLHERHLGGWAHFLKMILFLYILLLTCISALSTQWLSPDAFREWCEKYALYALILVPPMAIAVTGISTFIFDRGGSTRNFLAALPIPPRVIWWSRQRWAFPWLIAWCVAGILCDLVFSGFRQSIFLARDIRPSPDWLAYVISAIGWYAAGQLAGMASPNIIQAFVVAWFLLFLGLYLPGEFFPVGRDELWPGLAFVIRFLVFSAGVLAQTTVSLRPWLRRHLDNRWFAIVRSPILWTLVVMWFLLPALRVYLIQGPQSSKFEALRVSMTVIQGSPSAAKADTQMAGVLHTMSVLATIERLDAEYNPSLFVDHIRPDDDYSRQLWTRVSHNSAFMQQLADLTKTPYSDPFVACLFEDSATQNLLSADDKLVSSRFFHNAFFERLIYQAIEHHHLEYARIFFTADLCLRLRGHRTRPLIFAADFTGYSPATQRDWRAWADAVWAWCHAPGQTSHDIRQTLREIYDTWKNERIPFDERILFMYRYWRDLIFRERSSQDEFCLPHWPKWAVYLPGEKAAYQKRIDRIFSEWLTFARQYEADDILPGTQPEISDSSLAMWIGQFLSDSPAWVKSYIYYEFLNQRTIDVTVRATLLRMALRAYEIDHGHLPDQLADLVPDYLLVIPSVPGTQDAFIYFPADTEASARVHPELTGPCLAIPGLLGVARDGWPTEADRRAQARRTSWNSAFPESDVLVIWPLSPPPLKKASPQGENP